MRKRAWLIPAVVLLSGSVFARGPRWRQISVGVDPHPMQTIYAYDSLHIWASSYFGGVLNSNDGGVSWKKFTVNGIANSFFFLDTLNGWIAGQANYYPPPIESFRLHTQNGGQNWIQQLDTGTNVGAQITFLNPRKGFDRVGDGCTFKDSFLVTNDSGKTWQRGATGIAACNISRFFFVDSSNGWVMSSHPAPNNSIIDLVRTRNGGNTWGIVAATIPICAGAKLWFQDTLNGWMWHCNPLVSNQYRFSRTLDGGIHWDSLSGFDQYFWFYAFDALDSTHLWLAGNNEFDAAIQFSSDGGHTWIEQMPGVGNELIYALDATDENHAYAVGASGYVYIYSPQVVGDVNLDWVLTAADVVLMLNYTFLGMPTSVPPADMDFNNDCAVTGADVVLLLNKTFLGDPPLQWGCAQP